MEADPGNTCEMARWLYIGRRLILQRSCVVLTGKIGPGISVQ